MKKNIQALVLICMAAAFVFCANPRPKKNAHLSEQSAEAVFDTLPGDSLQRLLKTLKPVWGYRFVAEGDFDGDGQKERMAEHYTAFPAGQESPKYYEGVADYYQLVDIAVAKKPVSVLTSPEGKINPLILNSGGRHFGLAFLKNEGDLDGDGGEELSYSIQWADWSSTNNCLIATYKSGRWQTLFSFPIWEWQLPDLPQSGVSYGAFGLYDMQPVQSDSSDKVAEESLASFPGLISKIKPGKIKILFRDKGSVESTRRVNLARPPKMDW